MVRAQTGVYYWVNKPPSEWDEESAGPLKPWPPSDAERHEIDRNFEATLERLDEADRLAPCLVAEVIHRLQPALPESWSMSAAADAAVLTYRGARHLEIPLANGELDQMYFGILDGVQSAISEETTDAWPHDQDRGMHMWEPGVRVVDETLRGWYGPEANPVLALEPISLADLRSP